MENKTALTQLIERIPSAQEIKTAIFEGDMDEKMLDEWLWEKIFKGIDYLAIEKRQIIDTANHFGGKMSYVDAPSPAELYYSQTFKSKENDRT